MNFLANNIFDHVCIVHCCESFSFLGLLLVSGRSEPILLVRLKSYNKFKIKLICKITFLMS